MRRAENGAVVRDRCLIKSLTTGFGRDLYAMTSAPRDLSIAISGMFTIAVAAILLICMRIVKKKID